MIPPRLFDETVRERRSAGPQPRLVEHLEGSSQHPRNLAFRGEHASLDTVEIDRAVIEDAVHEGETMGPRDFVGLIERYHDDRPGVPQDAVAAYAHELAALRDYGFDAEGFFETVDERMADSESWTGSDRFYALDDDRLSLYPVRWHDALGGSTDAAEYVRYIRESEQEYVEALDSGSAGAGIPRDTLSYVIQVVGRVDRETAAAAIEDARDRDDVVLDAEQHPQAGVYLPEDVG